MSRTLFITFFLASFLLFSQNYPEKPSGYVTDKAGVLTTEQISSLNNKLFDLEKYTSNQAFVFIDTSLNGQDMEQTCQAIFHQWQIGQKNKNNGVLIGIFTRDQKFRIHTGYGLEGALPDILTSHIQDEQMRPRFKEHDYYGGLNDGIDKLIYYSKNEYEPEANYDAEPNWAVIIGYSVNIILFLVGLTFFSRLKRIAMPVRILVFLSLLIPFVGIIVFIVLYSTARPKGKRKRQRGYSSDSGYSAWDSTSSDSGSASDSSFSSSDFDGGGGGDSGGGGSDSDW
jgi:uncharacterized protein